jgi:hypothetical protein
MLIGYPVALGSVGFAFHRGGGRLFALLAYVLVAFPAILITIAISSDAGFIPLGIGIAGVVGLGYYGYVTRHRTPDRRVRRLRSYFVPPRGPTAKAVTAADVVGAWQFYVDAASQTVDIVFHEDGTFTQVLTHNRGGRTVCPGGTWKLDGPYVELSSYRTARGGALGSVRWWLGDSGEFLDLFGPDHPDLGTTYRIARTVPVTRTS